MIETGSTLLPNFTQDYDSKSQFKKEIKLCKNGHNVSDPDSKRSDGKCRVCRREYKKSASGRAERSRYRKTPQYKWKKMRYKIRRRILMKRERIQQLEQEIASGNGRIQDYQDY